MLRQICRVGDDFVADGTRWRPAREAACSVATERVGVGVGFATARAAAAVRLRVGQRVTVSPSLREGGGGRKVVNTEMGAG